MSRRSGRIGYGKIGRLGMVALVFGVLSSARVSLGAGLLIADGGFGGVLELREQRVDVTINNGVAVTKVAQVFHNTEDRQVEALYTFPVPKGASVANFSMWIGGKEMIGEVLEKERAREIYNSYKQKRQDPGLLEQVDYRTFEMRIFPIGPKADQRVEVTYYQELEVDHDRARYVYPLATTTREGVDSRVRGKFAMNVDILSAIPLTSVESPSHGASFVMARHAEDYVQASLETPEGSLAQDIVLSYQMRRPQTGLDVITSRPRGEDGFFQLTMTVGEDLAALDTGMDFVFVLDVSGSMAHDRKLLLSRDSIGAFLDALGDKDRFEVMSFNVQPEPLFNGLRDVGPESRAVAAAFLDSREGRGGTVLKPALDTALRYADPDRPLNIVILSDGIAEQRERATLLQVSERLGGGVRIFCIGVGNDVNRPLLEQLAQESGGLAAFISHGDNFVQQAQAFRRKLTRPVMDNLAIDFGGLKVYDLVPEKLPNLYHGSPVRMYGRYQGEGEASVTIKGTVQGRELKQSATLAFGRGEKQDNPEIERMWAWHRVDALQKQADRAGSRDAVISEIVRLGEGYSIVTEYTSFLVLENDAEFQRWKIERRNEGRVTRDRKAQTGTLDRLAALREKAVANIGPAAVEPAPAVAPAVSPAAARPASSTSPTPAVATPRPRPAGDSINFGPGTGPVGPLFLLLSGWLARRLRKVAA